MSVLMTITCDSCEEDVEVNGDPNNPPTTCNKCSLAGDQASLQAHLDACAALSNNERFQRIEEQLYLMQRQGPARSLQDMRF